MRQSFPADAFPFIPYTIGGHIFSRLSSNMSYWLSFYEFQKQCGHSFSFAMR
ncbi:Uncharacterised protein [Serratia proteamaculans]|nr:Uncharacterised protein [Serratia proteamaculans]